MTLIAAALIYDPVGDLAILSNYAQVPIIVDGVLWPSIEHFFQAQKFNDAALRELIRGSDSPSEAKRLAWSLDETLVRGDWPVVRRRIMAQALEMKFEQHPEAASALEMVWPMPVYEDSLEDQDWGIGADGTGQNMMGELLMEHSARLVGQVHKRPPLLTFRPEHCNESRYDFVDVISLDILFNLLDASKSELKSTELTELGVPELIWRSLKRDGLVVPNSDGIYDDVQSFIARLEALNRNRSGGTIADAVWTARREAFDGKYSGYTWEQDARSVFKDWAGTFLSLLEAYAGHTQSWTQGLVLGAGSGSEAAHLWQKFGNNVLLADIGPRLIQNCSDQAPASPVLCTDAENLEQCNDNQFGLYCALRTYQSAFFDIAEAMREAKRVLRSGGVFVVSVSNGYLGVNNEFVRGRLVKNGAIDLTIAANDVGELANLAMENGLLDLRCTNMGSELVLWARKP